MPREKAGAICRQWAWDEIAFQPDLATVSQPAPGVVLLRAQKNLLLGRLPGRGRNAGVPLAASRRSARHDGGG